MAASKKTLRLESRTRFMTKKYINYSLKEYLNKVSCKSPTPGGGSAAAYAGAMGTALLGMVTQYSLGKGSPARVEQRLQKILQETQCLQERLVELVDLDARAYQQVVAARKGSAREQQHAQRVAQKVPKEVCQLAYKAVKLAPYLVKHGNRFLLSDVEVALGLLLSAYNGGQALLVAS